MRGLPDGDYYVAAVDWLQADDVSGEWQDPEFLEMLARTASRISLSEGEEASVTPRVFVR